MNKNYILLLKNKSDSIIDTYVKITIRQEIISCIRLSRTHVTMDAILPQNRPQYRSLSPLRPCPSTTIKTKRLERRLPKDRQHGDDIHVISDLKFSFLQLPITYSVCQSPNFHKLLL